MLIVKVLCLGAGTVHDIVLWVEEAVAPWQSIPPEIRGHSANSAAGYKMAVGIQSVASFSNKS